MDMYALKCLEVNLAAAKMQLSAADLQEVRLVAATRGRRPKQVSNDLGQIAVRQHGGAVSSHPRTSLKA